LINEEVEVVHEAKLLLPIELVVEVDFRDEAKLVFEEGTVWELLLDRFVEDAIFQWFDLCISMVGIMNYSIGFKDLKVFQIGIVTFYQIFFVPNFTECPQVVHGAKLFR
jgi:hypothetical protein